MNFCRNKIWDFDEKNNYIITEKNVFNYIKL
jgi:hypothetical protein